ncbi:MAG TPA: NERD domain-containing protein [Acidimicrobiales bacterium]|nr:NERD domain-containing protein [Acidimicrobiales bacterium]
MAQALAGGELRPRGDRAVAALLEVLCGRGALGEHLGLGWLGWRGGLGFVRTRVAERAGAPATGRDPVGAGVGEAPAAQVVRWRARPPATEQAGSGTAADQLAELASLGWEVLDATHGAEAGGVDHLLVGAGGIYALSAKSHPGARIWVGEQVILVDRHRTPYLRNSRAEGARCSRALSRALGCAVEVRPALALGHGLSPSKIHVAGRPEDVLVLDGRDVAAAFAGLPRRLSGAEVAALAAAARRPETWQ